MDLHSNYIENQSTVWQNQLQYKRWRHLLLQWYGQMTVCLYLRCNQNFPHLQRSDHWQLCNGGYFHWNPNKNVHWDSSVLFHNLNKLLRLQVFLWYQWLRCCIWGRHLYLKSVHNIQTDLLSPWMEFIFQWYFPIP